MLPISNRNFRLSVISLVRLFYFYLWVVLQYSLRLYFRRIIIRNKSNYFFGRTIFVSNHQGSFMDPLLIASIRRPVVYFMVRSDVFNRFTKRIFASAHMLPIYRQRDGVDTIEKNQVIFQKTNELLKKKRNILIFGEGFTDDRIQRRLHPIKKGSARIGFSALEASDWKIEVYLQGLGVNYADFNLRGSEILIDAGTPICLNNYKDEFQANPTKTITYVTQLLESDMRTLIPDVQEPDWSDFHEDVMMLTRKGIHPTCFDEHLDFETRWEYSRKLAKWIDTQDEDKRNQCYALKESLVEYKENLASLNISENDRWVFVNDKGYRFKLLLNSLLYLPFAFFGLVHAALPIFLIKRWVEKKFKRRVFWGSTKMVMAFLIVPLVNIPIFFVVPGFLPFSPLINWAITVIYYMLIGVFAQCYLIVQRNLRQFFQHRRLNRLELSLLNQQHARLQHDIQTLIPVE